MSNLLETSNKMYESLSKSIASYGFHKQAVFKFFFKSNSYVFVLANDENNWHYFFMTNNAGMEFKFDDHPVSVAEAKECFADLVKMVKIRNDMYRASSFTREVVNLD